MGDLRTVVVEDERLARRKLVMLLSTEPGIELVGECGTAEEAVSLLRSERPDLVFLDIQLPGMDGFEVLQRAGLENVGRDPRRKVVTGVNWKFRVEVLPEVTVTELVTLLCPLAEAVTLYVPGATLLSV